MEDGKVMSKLNILYEDNHLIVVEKKPNVLSQGDATKDIDLLTQVKQYIKEKYHKPGNVYLGLVHRLDRPVGGIMVFAKTSKAAARLTKQMQEHNIEKKYYAVAWGCVCPKEGTLQDFILQLENGNSVIDEKGKEAILSYQVVHYFAPINQSLLDISLKTGRHHQIRVQFASRGYPLCGDQRYGRQDHTPLALFAYYLSFYHPITKEKMTFTITPKEGYFQKFSTVINNR